MDSLRADTHEAAERLVARLAEIFHSPELFPVHLDREHSALGFVPIERGTYEALPFHSVVGLRDLVPEARFVGLDSLLRRAKNTSAPSTPVHFILHTAFSGSTLLSRTLEAVTPTLAVREPDVLEQVFVSMAKARGDPRESPRLEAILGLVLRLLARHYPDQRATVVKASDAPSLALDELLAAAASNRAIFLLPPLESFVASAIKSAERRQWLAGRTAWLKLGPAPVVSPNARLTPDAPPGRIAATLWMMHLRSVRAAVAAFGSDRVRTIATPTFLDAPLQTVEALATFFNLDLRPNPAALLTPVLRNHAKSGRNFGPADREAELGEISQAFGSEIQDAIAWATAELACDPSSGLLPAPLLPTGPASTRGP